MLSENDKTLKCPCCGTEINLMTLESRNSCNDECWSDSKRIACPLFDLVEPFSEEGIAIVRIGNEKTGKYGYIDKEGKYIILPRFDHAEEFYDGLAIVGVDGKYGYID